MKQVTDPSSVTFEDRRQNRTENRPDGTRERRQFSNSYNSENQDVNVVVLVWMALLIIYKNNELVY